MPAPETPYQGGGHQGTQLSELKSAALESVANAIAITDREGIIVWVNPCDPQKIRKGRFVPRISLIS